MSFRILVINPGSTTTKIAVFEDDKGIFSHTLEHGKKEISVFATSFEQMLFRQTAVEAVLEEYGYSEAHFDIVVGRGGLLAPMHGGVWRINARMLQELADAKHGEHPCNLGAHLACFFAKRCGVEAVIVDPVVTDELDDIARISGLPELPRRSVFHALSQRAAARRAASQLGILYEQGKFLVCHMGGGVSVAAHRYGKICDVINALEGDGPFSPERTGRLTALGVLDLVKDGTYTYDQLRSAILKEGGMWAHLGTNDLREVLTRIDTGDRKAAVIFEALAYSIAKEISSFAPALLEGISEARGENGIDAIVMTGGMAKSEVLIAALSRRLEFLTPHIVVVDVEEMQALADGGLRVLRGEENPAQYTGTSEDIV